jgi:gamma-glutamyl phosphate reductase
VRCCEKTIGFHDKAIPAFESDWATEYLAPIISIKSVLNIDEAIEHIGKFGTVIQSPSLVRIKICSQNLQIPSIVQL